MTEQKEKENLPSQRGGKIAGQRSLSLAYFKLFGSNMGTNYENSGKSQSSSTLE